MAQSEVRSKRESKQPKPAYGEDYKSEVSKTNDMKEEGGQ